MKLEKVIDARLSRTFEWDRFLCEASKSLSSLKITFEKKKSLLLVTSEENTDMQAFVQALEFKISGKQYSHFYSLPMPLDSSHFAEFKAFARQTIEEPTLDLMFMPCVRLHLTVCMLSLQNDSSLAVSILKNLPFTPFSLQFDSLGFIGKHSLI